MQLGFLKYLLLGTLLIALGGFAWLALVDVPIRQQEITINVPITGAP